MKLNKILVKNFRIFKELEIDDFKNINLIVGNNNSGKTSLLEAIFLSIGISNPNLTLSIDRFRGLIHDESEDFRFIFHNLRYKDIISIELEFTNPIQIRELLIKPTYDNVTIINNLSNTNELISSTSKPENRNSDGIEYKFSISNNKSNKKEWKTSSIRYKEDGLIVKQPKSYKEGLFGIFVRPISTLGDVYERLDKIIIEKKHMELIEALKNIDDNIIDITLGAKNMIYFDVGIERRIPVQIMGDGIIRLLSILTAIERAKDGFVIIDEIENGFHYSVLPKLWKIVYNTAQQYNVQIFASTHSIECITAFRDFYSENLSLEDNFRLYRLNRLRNGVVKVVKYDYEVLDSSLESNWEIR